LASTGQDGDATRRIEFGHFVEVLGNRTELVPVLLGNDHQPSSASGNRVRQSACEVIMIASAVLILNHKF